MLVLRVLRVRTTLVTLNPILVPPPQPYWPGLRTTWQAWQYTYGSVGVKVKALS